MTGARPLLLGTVLPWRETAALHQRGGLQPCRQEDLSCHVTILNVLLVYQSLSLSCKYLKALLTLLTKHL